MICDPPADPGSHCHLKMCVCMCIRLIIKPVNWTDLKTIGHLLSTAEQNTLYIACPNTKDTLRNLLQTLMGNVHQEVSQYVSLVSGEIWTNEEKTLTQKCTPETINCFVTAVLRNTHLPKLSDLNDLWCHCKRHLSACRGAGLLSQDKHLE